MFGKMSTTERKVEAKTLLKLKLLYENYTKRRFKSSLDYTEIISGS